MFKTIAIPLDCK